MYHLYKSILEQIFQLRILYPSKRFDRTFPMKINFNRIADQPLASTRPVIILLTW